MPDLTSCFQETALVWTPCAFLSVFAVAEGFSMYRNKQLVPPDVPWTWVSLTRSGLACVLMLVALIELVDGVMAVAKGTGFPVDYMTPLIKLVTFTLTLTIMLANRKVVHHASVLLFLFWLLFTLVSVFSCYSLIKNLIRPVSPLLPPPFALSNRSLHH